MILNFVIIFFMILLITVAIFYIFCFFLPALKIKYEGISDSLATEIHFADENMHDYVIPNYEKVVKVQCDEIIDEKRRLFYKGERNCQLFHAVYGSEYKDTKVCIGFGDCVKVCPQRAISVKNGRVQISAMCNGCGKCIDFCPENILTLVKKDKTELQVPKKDFKFWYAWYKLLRSGFN